MHYGKCNYIFAFRVAISAWCELNVVRRRGVTAAGRAGMAAGTRGVLLPAAAR